MRFYFVTNDKFYSKMHRYLEKTNITHIGLGFENKNKYEIIIDCTKPKSNIYTLKDWLKKYRIVNILELEISEYNENLYFYKLRKECYGKEYNYGAYYYLLLTGLRYLLFRIPLPKENKLTKRNKFMCSEIMNIIKYNLKQYDINIENIDFGMKTPYMIFNILKEFPNIKIME